MRLFDVTSFIYLLGICWLFLGIILTNRSLLPVYKLHPASSSTYKIYEPNCCLMQETIFCKICGKGVAISETKSWFINASLHLT